MYCALKVDWNENGFVDYSWHTYAQLELVGFDTDDAEDSWGEMRVEGTTPGGWGAPSTSTPKSNRPTAKSVKRESSAPIRIGIGDCVRVHREAFTSAT